jgi:hypothetical protein
MQGQLCKSCENKKFSDYSKFKVEFLEWSGVEWSWICDRRSMGQYVLVSGRPLGPMTRFYMFFSLTCTSFFM